MGSKTIEKIAERDFYVYKVGQVLWNSVFVSKIRKYYYTPKFCYGTIPLIDEVLYGNLCIIKKGYHSYKWIAIDNTDPCNRYLYLGSYYNTSKEKLSSYEHCCIATFIVPKGAKYFENEDGHIVSSDIIYTGKYVKL